MMNRRRSLYRISMLVLSGLLIMGLVPFGYGQAVLASSTGKTYLHLNFDDYSMEPSTANPQSAPGGGGYWSLFGTNKDTDYAYGAVFPGKEGRSLALVSNTTGNNINIQKSGQTIPGSAAATPVVMEGKFMVDRTDIERRLFSATLTKLPNTATPVLGTIIVYMDASGKLKLEYPGIDGKRTIDLGHYAISTWYHMQLYVDVTSKQLTMFINGNIVAENVQLLQEGWDNLSSFRFTQMGKSGTQGKLILDDIKIVDYEPATGIHTDESEINIVPLEQRQLAAEVVPASSTNRYITWHSDDPAIAEVDETGLVSAQADGTTTVYAVSAEDDSIYAAITVHVGAYVAVDSVQIIAEPEQLVVETDRSVQLDSTVLPENATNKQVNWKSSDSLIATVDAAGLVTGHSVGSVTITAVSAEDESKFAESQVTVIARSTLTEQLILPAAVNVTQGDTVTVQPEFLPEDATNRELIWYADNSQIAEVNEAGVITGVAIGTTEIHAQVASGTELITATVAVTVIPQSAPQDDYEQMRMRWKDMLDGGFTLNTQSPAIAEQTSVINNRARSWSDTMITSNASGNGLWSDILPSTTDSGFFNSYLTRLRDMTYAYSIKGGDYYHHQTLLGQIKYGLNWIYTNAYNEHIQEYGNWWNFDIGAPARIMDILIMLQDELTEEEITRFVRTADHFIGDIMAPTFNSSGANRSDVMTIETLMAILTKDSTRLSHVLEQLKPLFAYVTDGDGFYQDGSYIQHGTIPYTGSYGEVLIRGLGNLFYLLKDSPWEVTDPNAAYVYRWIYDSVAPVIYRGETMDMIRGRAIAREEQTGHHATIGIISGMIRLAMAAPEEDARYFKQLIKHWLLTTNQELEVNRLLRLDLIEPIEAIMNDPSIVAMEDQAAHYEFGAMNRTVHLRDDFAFGISKSSRRIATYELTNGENGEGWYTGDGMTYLYTKDTTQFADDFWPTVNRYRLPGTTVDTRPRKNDHYQYGDGETTPGNTWAGGAVLGADGISGMKLQQVGTTLTANKSWFMFGDKIVALGSGINSLDNRNIETIVEQRKLNEVGNNALTIDGVLQPDTLGASNQTSGTEWIHLQGNVSGADIGYYFPDQPDLQVNRLAQTGSWYDINQNDAVSKDIRTRNYLSIWFDHGKNPINDTYSYVLLPNRTAAETKQFATQPSIEIVENSPEAHALADHATNQMGINFWQDAVKTVAGVTTNRQASVMLKHDDNTLDVAVADPTFVNTGVIELVINESAASVLEVDDAVFVTQLHPVIKMQVSTANSFSKSFRVKFDLDPLKPRPEPEAALPIPSNSKYAAGASGAIGHVHTTFDQDKLGNRPQGWEVSQSPNTTAVVAIADNQYSDDYALRLVDRNAEGRVMAAIDFPKQAKFLKQSWNFNDLLGNSGTTLQWLANGEPAITLALLDNILYWYDRTGNKHQSIAIDQTKWYRAELHASPVTGQWDLWIDGELIVAGAELLQADAAIDRMEIATGYEQDEVHLYMDDVIVYVAGAETLIQDDFESYSAGGSPGDWVVVERKNTAPVSVVWDEEDRNHSVLLDDQDTTFRATLSKRFPAQTDRFIAKWRYKELGGGKYPEFQLLNQSTQAIRLSSSSNNNLRYYGPGASANSVATLAKTKIGAWHTVKLDVRPAEQTYDIYFDDILVEQNLGFYTAAGQIDGILFGSAYGAPDAPLYIDDVEIYTFDTQPPYWEEDAILEQLLVTDNKVQLQWQAAEDNLGIGWYNLYQNNELVQQVSGAQTTAVITLLQPQTDYRFALRAVDQNGNESLEELVVDVVTQSRPAVAPPYVPGITDQAESKEEEEQNVTIEQLEELRGSASSVIALPSGFALRLPAEWIDGIMTHHLPSMIQLYNTSAEHIRLVIEAGLVEADDQLTLRLQRAVEQQFGIEVGAGAEVVATIDLQLALQQEEEDGKQHSDAVSERVTVEAARLAYAELYIPLTDDIDPARTVVMWWDEQNKQLIYVPATFVRDGQLHQIIVHTLQTGRFVVVSLDEMTTMFTDMSGHWAAASVANMTAKGLLKGVANQQFAPEQSVTRAEFAMMLTRSLGLSQVTADQLDLAPQYTDVTDDQWFASAVYRAQLAGLINGYPDGSFRPKQTITREEAAVLLHRALLFAGNERVAGAEKQQVEFQDAAELSMWATAAVHSLHEQGLMQGMGGNKFQPQTNMTRAQMAVLFERMLQHIRFISF